MAHILSVEPLEQAEIIFVLRRYQKASKDYMRVMNLILLSSGILPFVIAFMFLLYSADIDLVVQVFIFLLISLLAFFILVAVIFYFQQIYNKYRDAMAKTKTIESCVIIEKKAVPINLTYHFFIDSRVKYSIEVSEEEFDHYQPGDEINIEYTTFDKEYLAHF